jgi:hypothetical protein
MIKNYKLKMRLAAAAACLMMGFGAMAQVSVTATAGTLTGTYTTVNAAFAAINAGTHQGAISIGITGNTTEPATPNPLLASGTGSSVYTAVSISPSGGNFTISSAAAPVTNRGIIELAGADNVTIDGDDAATPGAQNLSIVSAAVSTAGVACIRLSSNSTTGTDGANNVTVKNCIIRGSRSSATSNVVNYGIEFSNGVATSSSTTGAYSSLNTLIQNNIITRCWYGIHTIGNAAAYLNTGLQIIGNTIGSATATEYVAGRGIVVSYTGIAPGAGSALIKGNDIRIGHTNGSSTLFAVDVAVANSGLTITSNNIHDCINPTSSVWGMHAIDVNSSTTNTGIRIENNFIRDITGYTTVSSLGNQYAGIGIFISADVTGLLINNNSIVQSTASRGTCVEIATAGTTIAQFQNNLLMANENSVYSSCFYTAAAGNISGGVVNNNNYYMSASALLGYYNGANQATLAAWRTATGKDALSLNELPVFTSATDLHVPAGSITLLESAGASTASTGVTIDIDAQARPGISTFGYGTAPDIGADEFDGKAIYSCVTPTPGNTIASSNPICMGSTVAFSLQNATAGTGVTYQWQVSTDNVTYTNIAGANLPAYSTTPATDSYYRAVVTCAQGPVTGTSTPVHITYNYAISSTTPGSRCGAGTVSLSATGTGTSINWYAAATGGSSLGSGSPFTTPVISSTTTYYAEPNSVAPSSVTIGTGVNLSGATTQPTAFCNRWKQYWCQMVYTAAELNAAGLVAGNITSLSFRITTLGDAANVTNFSVSLGPVGTSTLTGFTTTGLTTVYGPATYTHAVGVNTITFSTPYAWDGVSNILVDLKQNGADLTNNAITYFTPTAGNTCATAVTSSVTPVLWTSSPTATLNTQRLDATFAGMAGCAGARSAVVATIGVSPAVTVNASQTVCNDEVAALTVTSTLSDYDSYVWSPMTGLYTDAAGTVAYTGTSATTVYARTTTAGATTYTVTANNSATSCAALTTSTVTTLPGTIAATASPSSICVSGTSVISASPATGYGAGSLQWQSSSDNITFSDIASATSATYTTPTLTGTTYYRLTIRNSAGTLCTTTSSVATVTVNNPQVLTTTPAARCGTGTVNLGATVSAGATLNWYAAATGGAPLATGTSFTTPSIAATTTYFAGAEVYSPSTITIGTGLALTGATTQPTAFCNRWKQYWCQMVYTAAELHAAGLSAGNITSLAFRITTIGDAPNVTNFTVSLGASASTLTGFTTTGLTAVYGPATYTQAIGLNTITFATPYNWDGVSNILVDLRQNGADLTNNSITYFTATTGNTCANAVTSSTTPVLWASAPAATLNTQRLDVTFAGPVACSGPRSSVVATVNTPPAITVSAASGTICAGAGTTVNTTSANTGYTYTWNPGTLSGASQAVSPAATTTYSVSAVDASGGANDGCATTGTVTVNVTPLPLVVPATATPAVLCAGGNSQLAVAGYSALAYCTPAMTTVSASGDYLKSFTFANISNLNTADAASDYTYYNALTANVTAGTPNNLTLEAGGTTSLYAQQFRIWIDYNQNGTFEATESVYNTTTSSISPTVVTGTVTVPVTAYNGITRMRVMSRYSATPAASEACLGGSQYGEYEDYNVKITGATDAPGLTFSWSPAAFLSSATISNPVATAITSTTTYTVNVTASGCSASSTAMVTVNPVPVAPAASGTAICTGTTATLTTTGTGTIGWYNASTGGTYLAGGTSFTTPVLTSAATYYVQDSSAAGCTSGRTAVTVNVNALPVVTANTTAAAVCENAMVTLTGGGATSYTWTGAVTDGVAFAPAATSTYTVTGTDGNGCVNTATTTITVNTLPTVAANSTAAAVCDGSMVTLTGSGATSYTWTGSVADGVAFTPATTDTYTVTGTDANGCMNTATATVTVNALPTVAANSTAAAVCEGSSVTLTGSGATSYTWTGSVADGVAFTPAATDTYTVTGTDGNGCMNTATTTVTVNTLPTVAANSTAAAVCDGSMVTLTGSGATSYTWTGSVADGVAFTPVTTDTYTVTGTDANGCMNTATTTVTVNTLPTVAANSTAAAVCDGSMITLTGSGATSYTWTGSVADGVAFTPATTDTYTVTGTDANGCMNTATTTVTVNTLPTVAANSTAAAVCEGSSVTLTGSGATSYTWTGSVADGVAFTPAATDTYTVTGTDGNGCMNTATTTVTVNAAPSVSMTAFDPLPVCIFASPFTLTNGSPAGGVYSGAGVSSGVFDPNAAGLGTFVITYMVTDVNSCSASDTASVTVDICEGIATNNGSSEITVYPNPASNMINISVGNANFSQLTISIVDIQGKEVYNETDKNISADYNKQINIEQFAKGVYYIKMNTGNDSKVQKLIVH